jgi:hypothetical protein
MIPKGGPPATMNFILLLTLIISASHSSGKDDSCGVKNFETVEYEPPWADARQYWFEPLFQPGGRSASVNFNGEKVLETWVTKDDGRTWYKSSKSRRHPLAPRSLACCDVVSATDPFNSKHIIRQNGDRFEESFDGSRTWQAVAHAKILQDNATIRGRAEALAEFKRNGGQLMTNELPWTKLIVEQIAFDPIHADVTFLVTNKGIYRRLQSNGEWTLLRVGIDRIGEVSSMSISPKTGVVLVGTAHGIYRSLDQGCTFMKSLEKAGPPEHPYVTVISKEFF